MIKARTYDAVELRATIDADGHFTNDQEAEALRARLTNNMESTHKCLDNLRAAVHPKTAPVFVAFVGFTDRPEDPRIVVAFVRQGTPEHIYAACLKDLLPATA